MDIAIQPATAALRGVLTLPPDKAIAHRAILLAALAEGTTAIHPWPQADDCQRTAELIQEFGVQLRIESEAAIIEGMGAAGLSAPRRELFCGESGTTLRLAAGCLAGQPFTSRLTASPSLARRPMRRIAEPLTQMGARLEGVSPSEAGGEYYPPLTIHGRRPLRAICYEPRVPSAQVKSAVLLAGLFADGPTTVIEPRPTRDHTERMLERFGRTVHREGMARRVEPGPLRAPGTVALPGDCSSAAFFAVAACCVPGSTVTLQDVGLNPTRTEWLTVLQRMGARLRVMRQRDDGEPVGTIVAEFGQLQAVTLEPAEAPAVIDELPILMVAAACARGRSSFQGLAELRVKETDRIQSMIEGLQRLGARIRVVEPETVEIEGGVLRAAAVDSFSDHRTAMSLAVAALSAKGSTVIRGAECVAKSFPDFFERLAGLAGSSTVKSIDKP